MNYNQISELLYDAIWSASERTSERKLFEFYKELNKLSGGNTLEFMETFSMENNDIRKFVFSIFKAKEFSRLPELKVISNELKLIRKQF